MSIISNPVTCQLCKNEIKSGRVMEIANLGINKHYVCEKCYWEIRSGNEKIVVCFECFDKKETEAK